MRAALAVPGCDGLEFDVRGSRDGVPVLLHDATLDRVQGRPERVGDLTAAELEEAGIPSLAVVLEVAGARPFLDVELKGAPVPGVIGVLEVARGPELDGAVVSSFEAPTLAWVGRQRPRWARWLNATDLEPATLAIATKLGCRGVSVEWRAIDRRGMARAAALGLTVAAWTVRRRVTADRLERLGVTALCVEAAALDASR
jgi:glycerophosphoryl diester phosphodiesterase